jgi:hypothetical protein
MWYICIKYCKRRFKTYLKMFQFAFKVCLCVVSTDCAGNREYRYIAPECNSGIRKKFVWEMSKRKYNYNWDCIVIFGITLSVLTVIVFYCLLFLLLFVVFELNRGINSKWTMFDLCHFSIHWRIRWLGILMLQTYILVHLMIRSVRINCFRYVGRAEDGHT